MRNGLFLAGILCLLTTLMLKLQAEENAVVKGEQAARRAANFLLEKMNPDGTFGESQFRFSPGVVGLVIKALVESPDKPTPDKNEKVAKAVAYLVGMEQPDGSIGFPTGDYANYNTSVAAVALKALNDPKYKDLLEKARKFILSCQLDESKGYKMDEHFRAAGGFGYGGAKRSDVSNTAFALEALKELGLDPNHEAFANAKKFLQRSQDNTETNDLELIKGSDNTGGFVYLPGESMFGEYTARSGKKLPKPYGSMTYMAVKSLIYCGVSKDSPELTAAFRWMRNNYSVEENPGAKDNEGYYYYLVAFAKAFSAAGIKEFELEDGRKINWAEDLIFHLAALQNEKGGYTMKSARWWENDEILITSYALQALNLALENLKK